MKSIKCMNILNFIYAALCLLSVLGSSMNFLAYALEDCNETLANICDFIFPIGPLGMMVVTFVPLGAVGWLIGVIHHFANARNEEYRRCLGRKRIWLIVWPILIPLLWLAACGALVGFTGGV